MANVTHDNKILPNRSMVINSYTLFRFDANTFVDPDGDTITYSATGMPGGVRIYGPDCRFYGTPYTQDTVGNYYVDVTATSADGSADTLTFILRLGAIGQVTPKYPIPAAGMYSAGPFSVNENVAINTQVGTPVVANLGATPNTYSVVWSDSNSIGASYGNNASPFSVNNSGQIYVSGSVDYETKTQHTLFVEAKITATGFQDVAKVVINVNNINEMYCFTPPPIMILIE